jgi:hypothetical protein
MCEDVGYFFGREDGVLFIPMFLLDLLCHSERSEESGHIYLLNSLKGKKFHYLNYSERIAQFNRINKR